MRLRAERDKCAPGTCYSAGQEGCNSSCGSPEVGIMRTLFMLTLALIATGCAHHAPPAASSADSPFAMASGITKTDGDARAARVIPLNTMTGDVEILYGDPEKAGEPFVMRIRELPGTLVPVHSHPVDEHITVVEGTWFFAVGDRWDRAQLKEIKAGGYAFAPKGSSMFGYSPDGAVVQVHGVGPFHIHWAHGSKTLDDADAATVFTFKRGERVDTPRGKGTIGNGYASGEIIQYEITTEDGRIYMVSQHELRR